MGRVSLGGLVVPSQYNTATCYHWGELGKGHKGHDCILSYNCTYLYNYLRIKGLIKNTKQIETT